MSHANLESKLASCRELHIQDRTPSRSLISPNTQMQSRDTIENQPNANGLCDKGMVKRLDFSQGSKMVL